MSTMPSLEPGGPATAARRPAGGPCPCAPWLLLLFAGSGGAALIYEIVWFQLLELVVGSSAVSLGILLGTFMGGMFLGSLGLARFVPMDRHPLRVYAFLELGLGALGLAIPWLLPWVARLYVAGAAEGAAGIALRGAVAAVCLLPSTLLMGATFPAMARWLDATPRGASWLGFFYGTNMAGAVAGSLVAGFYLLRLYTMASATAVAAAINAAAALSAFVLAARRAWVPALRLDEPIEGTSPRWSASAASAPPGTAGVSGSTGPVEYRGDAPERGGMRTLCLAIALSGLCAMGAEVIWTRLLSLLLGPTVYTFSIILAVFLAGLGLGSVAGSLLARGTVRPRLWLGACQALAAVAIAWSAWTICRSLPYWPINPALSANPWLMFQVDLVRCIWAVLPAACFWGASFPLALAAASAPGRDPGVWVGRICAANTLGAVVGALGSSLLLLVSLGTQQIQRQWIVVSVVSALVLWMPGWMRLPESAAGRSRGAGVGRFGRAGLVVGVTLATAGLLAWSVPPLPWGLVAFGRYLPTRGTDGRPLYVGEGVNASVAVTETDAGVRNFHVSGKVEASTERQDMRLQRMLGHIPGLLHREPRSVLVVGCGAGVTAGSFVTDPGIRRIVICEIESLIPGVVAKYFGNENHEVLRDPRVQVVHDDARHFILTTREKFDIITSDPIHPWVKGAATLYTREYFELVRSRLNPGGLVTQWVPLYESNPAVVKSELATFLQVFPRGTVWSNDIDGHGYDLVLLGGTGEPAIDLDEVHRRLRDNALLARSLEEVGFRSVYSLFATYAGRGPDLALWLKGAQLNRDGDLRLQYLAGLGLNLDQGGAIYDDLLACRRYPPDLFLGSPERVTMLKALIERSNLDP